MIAAQALALTAALAHSFVGLSLALLLFASKLPNQ
jgi:hypothetical protein